MNNYEELVPIMFNHRQVMVKPIRNREAPYEDRPFCFKTKEYQKNNKICVNCRHNNDCAKKN